MTRCPGVGASGTTGFGLHEVAGTSAQPVPADDPLEQRRSRKRTCNLSETYTSSHDEDTNSLINIYNCLVDRNRKKNCKRMKMEKIRVKRRCDSCNFNYVRHYCDMCVCDMIYTCSCLFYI
ncbi:hypothetical protein AAHE18_01G001600 [Arachis hypogaea]